jgi:peptide/nickel transport system ATP-binding protein
MTATPTEAAAIIGLEGLSRDFQRPPVLAERLLALLGRKALPPVLKAVTDVDLAIRRGEVLGLVGESGCGKSTLGRMVSGILPPTRGRVTFDGQAVATLAGRDKLAYVLGVQMIFQDPYASLNPRQKVGDIIAEPLKVHHMAAGRREVVERVDRALAEVGLDPSYKERYPHQFSGGQRQRIGIARAFIVNPRFLVCDEPIAALDVSIQAQVINLFMDLRDKYGLTYLFISHDLSVVRHIADRVAIMYLGRLVEIAPAGELFARPAHPYTRALLAEIPSIKRRRRKFQPVQGELPSPLDPPPGCAFHPRCPFAIDRCREERPALQPIAANRQSACHLNDQI